MNRAIILLSITLAACTSPKTATQVDETMTTTAADATEPAAEATVDAANARFLAAFDAGDAGSAAAHYDDAAVWYLTNGMAISGRESIEAFLAEAHSDGAGAFEFEAREVQPVGEHRYTKEQFAFDFAPGKTVSGTRYGLWTQTDTSAVLLQDVWVPAIAAPAALLTVISGEMDVLAKAYNDGDAAALRALYAADGTMVLSSGKVVGPDELGAMLDQTAAMGIDDMRFGEQTVYAAGDAAYSIGSFDVTLPTPDGDIPLSGTRLTLWRKNGDAWQIALELSWPRPKQTASVEAGGMKFEWRFGDGHLRGSMRAPTNGWVAVGFNDEETLAGSRLIMARVVDGEVIAQEHIAQPPNHRDIRSLGAPNTLTALRGKTNGVTEVEFTLDTSAVTPSNLELRPGQRIWLTLAFSESPDFEHHSRFRTAQSVEL